MSKDLLLDVQGLRCVAVIFVVLFHLWPTIFQNGFLGVDIFFVISGFIMCKILHKKPIDFGTVQDFYLRRFRRIIPLYLSVIVGTIYAAFKIMNSMELNTVAKESKSAMFFVSNMFNLPETGYFGAENRFPLFLHTWSLSVELQFYVVVPMIFCLLEKFNGITTKGGAIFLVVIGLVSLALQNYFSYDENRSHMSLYCRIWQFLAGFAAFCIRNESFENGHNDDKYQLLNGQRIDDSTIETRDTNLEGFRKVFTVQSLAVVLMISQLCIKYAQNKEIERILIVITATILLSFGDSILSMKRFVKIGDISYAIYLIHWPFLELFNFGDFGKTGGNAIGIQDGVFVIASVLIIAYLLENFFKTLSSYMTSWIWLVPTLLLLYSTAYCATIFIESKSWETNLNGQSNATISFEEQVIKLYENRGNYNLTTEEVIKLNVEMKEYAHENFSTCHNKSRVLPTDVKVDWKGYSYWCHKRGNGRKEVLLFGNSISRDLYFGVQHYFADVFDHLTFIGVSGCIPFALKTEREECGPYVKQIIPIIKQWHRPVDIVIIQQSYLKLWPHNYTKHDVIQQDIQQFYDKLSPLVNDVIFMSSADFFQYHSFQKMQNAILNNEDLSRYQIRYGYGRSLYGDTQRRIDAINCKKCWKVDYSQQYCDKIKDSCTIIHENRILQHHDGRHSSMYGSLLLAEKLREEYEHWENSRTEI